MSTVLQIIDTHLSSFHDLLPSTLFGPSEEHPSRRTISLVSHLPCHYLPLVPFHEHSFVADTRAQRRVEVSTLGYREKLLAERLRLLVDIVLG